MLTTALCNLRVTTAGHCFNDDSFTNRDEPTRLSLQHEETTAFHFSHRRSLFLPSARLPLRSESSQSALGGKAARPQREAMQEWRDSGWFLIKDREGHRAARQTCVSRP